MRPIRDHVRQSSRGSRLFLLGALWFLCLHPAAAQTLQDFFTNRVTISSANGRITQDNSTATVEPNEPNHGGKPGGHSLWISWVAPTNGIIHFQTEASTFDTVMSAYKFNVTNGSTFADLREVARSDDAEGLQRESEVEFGVVAGERYEIAVDGYFGAVGSFDFAWKFDALKDPPPQFLNLLPPRTVNLGAAVTLSFNITNAAAGNYKWLLNGNELGGSSAALNISSFSAADVGTYVLRVSIGGGLQFFSVPIEVQINTEGLTTPMAQAKILDAPSSPLIGGLGPGRLGFSKFGAGVVSGYNGSQIFNTTFSVNDPTEPQHCGVNTGKSYWLSYQPPANGTITLDTVGSGYDTVMETYTYNGTLTNYSNLISLACANDSFPSGTASQIILPVAKSRSYLIVVAGVNSSSGTAYLNYRLNTNQPPQPPTLTSQPQPRAVVVGSTLNVIAPVTGSPPLAYRWTKDGSLLPGRTSSSLLLANLTAAQSGNYSFTVSNDMGQVSGTFALRILVPPVCELAHLPSGLQLRFTALRGQLYTVEESSNANTGWISWPGSFAGNDQINSFDIPGLEQKFYRIRVE